MFLVHTNQLRKSSKIKRDKEKKKIVLFTVYFHNNENVKNHFQATEIYNLYFRKIYITTKLNTGIC